MDKHLLSAADLTAGDITLVLDTAAHLAKVTDRAIKKVPTLRGRTVCNLFFEDSTRTRISFELAAKLGEIEGREVPAGALDVAMYRDDIGMRPPQATHDTELPFDLAGKVVVLVDDVLYTGRTVRAALDALTDFGRPRAIQLAVLVDRGHRELPLRADYVGKNLPTAPDQAVRVLLAETDGSDGVVIEGPARKAVAS